MFDMKYGLELPGGGPAGHPHILAEFAELGERSGWDGVFLEDYVVYYSPDGLTYDPWVTLAAMATRTERIRLGTAVTAPARWRPWQLARQLVTLDHLSGGRMIFAAGLGDPLDFARFGESVDPRVRAQMLDEGLRILAGLWSGEPFRFAGKHYRLPEEVVFLPRPVQSPRIPIWIGGSSERRGPLERAARWDGFIPVPKDGRHLTPDDVRSLAERIEQRRGTLEGFDIAVGGLARGEDREGESRLPELAEAGVTWWQEAVYAADYATMRAAIERGPARIA